MPVMTPMTPEEARAYFKRWELVRDVEAAELKQARMETKFQQLAALMASRHLFGPEPDREAQVVRGRRGIDAEEIHAAQDERHDRGLKLRAAGEPNARNIAAKAHRACQPRESPAADVVDGAGELRRLERLRAVVDLLAQQHARRSEGLQVAVVRNGRAELVTVTIGRDYGRSVEVTSGLLPTDAVILDPADSLVSGTAVRVREQPAAPKAEPKKS